MMMRCALLMSHLHEKGTLPHSQLRLILAARHLLDRRSCPLEFRLSDRSRDEHACHLDVRLAVQFVRDVLRGASALAVFCAGGGFTPGQACRVPRV